MTPQAPVSQHACEHCGRLLCWLCERPDARWVPDLARWLCATCLPGNGEGRESTRPSTNTPTGQKEVLAI